MVLRDKGFYYLSPDGCKFLGAMCRFSETYYCLFTAERLTKRLQVGVGEFIAGKLRRHRRSPKNTNPKDEMY